MANEINQWMVMVDIMLGTQNVDRWTAWFLQALRFCDFMERVKAGATVLPVFLPFGSVAGSWFFFPSDFQSFSHSYVAGAMLGSGGTQVSKTEVFFVHKELVFLCGEIGSKEVKK